MLRNNLIIPFIYRQGVGVAYGIGEHAHILLP